MTIDASFDAGFRPKLHKRQLELNQQQYLNVWRFENSGTPFPTMHGRRGAFWTGTFNDQDEAPVVALTTLPGVSVQPNASDKWFVGVAHQGEIAQIDLQEDVTLYYADAASYNFDKLPDAIKFLQNILPITVAPVHKH